MFGKKDFGQLKIGGDPTHILALQGFTYWELNHSFLLKLLIAQSEKTHILQQVLYFAKDSCLTI